MSPHERFPGTEARRWDAFLRITRAVGAYLHELQRERGVSALHAESGGRIFTSELASQRPRTDARARAAAAAFESAGASLLADARRAIDRVDAATRAVTGMRSEVGRSGASSRRIVETYSVLNSELLTTIDDVCSRLDLEEARRLALASLALQHAKEKTGLERARLATGFLSGEIALGDRMAIAELVAARTSYLHVYELSAPGPVAQMLRRALAAPPAREVMRIEERLMAMAPEAASGPDGAQKWFALISRIIETLQDVGDATLNYLEQPAS
jgi:hypothetical protein